MFFIEVGAHSAPLHSQDVNFKDLLQVLQQAPFVNYRQTGQR